MMGAPSTPRWLPSAITLAGYGMALWWLKGGPAWAAIGSIIADDVDGRVARATGTVSDFGGALDIATDVTLTGLAAERLGILPVLPVITAGQVALYTQGVRAKFGSARAALMLAAILLGKPAVVAKRDPMRAAKQGAWLGVKNA